MFRLHYVKHASTLAITNIFVVANKNYKG